MLNATVLIIDPSADTRAMYGDYLRHHGHNVWEAGTAAEGARLATRIQPHVVVTELLFPNEDGLAFIADLRRTQHAETVILVCSTDISPVWPYPPAGSGVDSALQKPISPKAVLTEVKHLRGQWQVG